MEDKGQRLGKEIMAFTEHTSFLHIIVDTRTFGVDETIRIPTVHKDTLIWNLNDPIVTPETFAQTIVEDTLALSYHNIQDQLSDFKAHSTNYDGESDELLPPSPSDTNNDNNNDIQEESHSIRGIVRRRVVVQVELVAVISNRGRNQRLWLILISDEDGDSHMFGDTKGKMMTRKPMTLNEIKIDEQAMHEDIRILIKLDTIIGSIKLDDQFEWDLDNPMASPEEFAGCIRKSWG